MRNADDIFDIYERAVGGNSIFLLNIPPNREGRFSPADVAVLKETGERIRETYGTNLLTDAKGPKEVLDNNDSTYLLLDGETKAFTIELPRPRPSTECSCKRPSPVTASGWSGTPWTHG